MVANHLLKSGERYVAIYRGGLPMITQFKELKNGDLLLLNDRNNGKYQEVFVSYHDANQSGEDWFVHDPHFNAIFADDCDKVCEFDCEETPIDVINAITKLINCVLALCDIETARQTLKKNKCDEIMLRKFGFAFLFDHVGI